MKMRQRPGRAGRAGNRDPRGEAKVFPKPRGEVGNQLFLAAEQMTGAFDVKEKSVGAIVIVPRRGGRRVARRPQSQLAQSSVVGRGFGRAHLQESRFSTRIGKRFA